MKLENVAKVEKGFIEKSISIQPLDNGNFEIVAKAIPTGKKKDQEIRMEFTQRGYLALVGCWLALAEEEA